MTRLLLITLLAGCSAAPVPPAAVPKEQRELNLPKPRDLVPIFSDAARQIRATRLRLDRAGHPWLRGSTHVHTLYSGDSRTRPEKVVKWYADRDYDFIVITDHNRVTDGVSANLKSDSLIVMSGNELTNNPPSCEPPPPEPKGKCRVHVNALFASNYPPNTSGERPEKIEWREKKSIARVDLYQAALTKTKELGGLAQLNHPTWHWGVDGALTVELAKRGLRFIEIANVAFERWNGGTDAYPGTETLWDAALSEGYKLWGVASDDAHHYYDIERRKAEGGALYPPGGGFVMVRAERNATSIEEAMARGDFYASTGILFARIEITERELIVELEPSKRRGVSIEFVGTGSKVLEVTSGTSARFVLSRVKGSYVRARARAADGSMAWTQPVFVK